MNNSTQTILTYTCLMILSCIGWFQFFCGIVLMMVVMIAETIMMRKHHKEMEKDFDEFFDMMDKMCEDCDDENCERNKKYGKETNSNEAN